MLPALHAVCALVETAAGASLKLLLWEPTDLLRVLLGPASFVQVARDAKVAKDLG